MSELAGITRAGKLNPPAAKGSSTCCKSPTTAALAVLVVHSEDCSCGCSLGACSAPFWSKEAPPPPPPCGVLTKQAKGREKVDSICIMELKERSAEHCCICIPGRACVERFVTCVWPMWCDRSDKLLHMTQVWILISL